MRPETACDLARVFLNGSLALVVNVNLSYDASQLEQDRGWLPQHLVAKDSSGRVRGVCPLYMKSHSYGEYVFDQVSTCRTTHVF